jgi:hypothetical protein
MIGSNSQQTHDALETVLYSEIGIGSTLTIAANNTEFARVLTTRAIFNFTFAELIKAFDLRTSRGEADEVYERAKRQLRSADNFAGESMVKYGRVIDLAELASENLNGLTSPSTKVQQLQNDAQPQADDLRLTSTHIGRARNLLQMGWGLANLPEAVTIFTDATRDTIAHQDQALYLSTAAMEQLTY